MKKPFLPGLAIASLTALSTVVAFNQHSYAQSYDSTTFYCGTSDGYPATIVSNPELSPEIGDVAIIKWTSKWASPDWTPEKRCREVSSRFQAYFNDGSLNFIKGGNENGYPVLCVTDRQGAPCKGLLFTLKLGSDPNQAVEELMKIRTLVQITPMNQSSVPVLYRDSSGTYINWKEFIAAKRSMMATKSWLK